MFSELLAVGGGIRSPNLTGRGSSITLSEAEIYASKQEDQPLADCG